MTNYWDKWEREAIAAGVAPELAQLGREVMRDHYEHGKEDFLLGEESDGDRMLKLCLKDAQVAKQRFQDELYPNNVMELFAKH